MNKKDCLILKRRVVTLAAAALLATSGVGLGKLSNHIKLKNQSIENQEENISIAPKNVTLLAKPMNSTLKTRNTIDLMPGAISAEERANHFMHVKMQHENELLRNEIQDNFNNDKEYIEYYSDIFGLDSELVASKIHEMIYEDDITYNDWVNNNTFSGVQFEDKKIGILMITYSIHNQLARNDSNVDSIGSDTTWQMTLTSQDAMLKYDYTYNLVINEYGWSEEDFNALINLWNKESRWSPSAHNDATGAHGIAQACPASKMTSEGSDYLTNGETQVRWGLKYIKNTYGTPSNAWSHSQSTGWY